jgi:hypothetical protein
MDEQRKTERIFRRIPVRVRGVDELGKSFFEDTTTMEINRDGARVPLRNAPRFGATLEMTNLSKNTTTTSRVTRRCPQSYSGMPEWGIEFAQPVPDFWGIAFEASSEEQELVVSALLVCKSCGRREMANLSRAEYEWLGQEYFLSRSCSACGSATDWEVAARDEEEPLAMAALAGSATPSQEATEERRRVRRLMLKAPVLVTAPGGASELLEAQDFSKHGLSFLSSLELEPGDQVRISVGHGVAESPSVKNCLVIWRKPRQRSGKYLYGVKFLDSEQGS